MQTRGVKVTKVEDFTNGGPVLCTGVKPDKAYVDGKPTDQICGTRYEVVFPANGYVRAVIKTPELKPAFTEDDLFYRNGVIEIDLIGFYATVYLDSRTGQPAFSLKAQKVVEKIAPPSSEQ